MNQFKKVCAAFLALCLMLTCGILAYAEISPQKTVQTEESVEIEIDEVTENEEYTESAVCFTDDGMLILPRPVKEGKVFVEWNTKEDGTGKGYKAGEIVDPENIELYSIWADEEITDEEITEADIPDEIVPDEEPEVSEAKKEEITEPKDEELQNVKIEISEPEIMEAAKEEEPQEEITEPEDEEPQNEEIEE